MVTVTPLDLVLQVGGMRGIEWIIIIGVVLLLIFGVNKIPQLAKSFGRAQGEYEKAKIEMRREVDKIKTGETSEREKLEYIAKKLNIEYTNKTDDDLRKAIEADIRKDR